MRLSKLLEQMDTRIVFDGEWDREIDCLVTDSRERQKNSMFICLIGEQTDAHTCVAEAIRNGAVAIVAERETVDDVPQIIVPDTRKALSLLSANFYGNPQHALKIIGITGTNGKTTTSYMLAEILKQTGKKVGVIGTLGVVYDHKKYATDLTTPDPIFLWKTLAEMRVFGVEYVIMEVSAHALYYCKIEGIEFIACLFSNLTQDHLDFFENMQAYKQIKLTLFAKEICPIAIVNGDDEAGREIIKMRENCNVKTISYGMNSPTDVFAIITDERLQGTECLFNLHDTLCRVSLKMTGLHNVYNALSAAACAVELGVEVKEISKGLSTLMAVKGRLERVGSLQGAEIYVDFAHTPDGLEKSLETLKKHCKGRLVCVVGCGGNRDKSKRPVMGETVAKKVDFTVLTSDNPRYEDPLDILSEIERGYRRFSSKYVVVPDRKVAIEYALDFINKGDILLVAGKGGEEYQEIMGIKYAFNDHTVIEKIIRQKEKTLR